MAVKLGLDAKLYRNTGTIPAPVWNEIHNVKDVTLNLEAGDGDIATAGSQGLRATCAVTNFSRNEALEEAITVSVTVKPTYSVTPPAWIIVP